MTDEPTTPVSLSKDGAAAPAPERPPRPRQVLLATAALVASAVAALVAALGLQLGSVKSALLVISRESNAKLAKDKQLSADKLKSNLDQGVHSQLVATIVLALALGFVAYTVYQGRHTARWWVIGIWVLSSVTSTFAGLTYLLAIGVSAPGLYKVPAFLAALFALLAVVFVNLRPSVAYFNLSRPARLGAAGAKRGLFSPRVPPADRPARAGAAGSTGRTFTRAAATRAASSSPAGTQPAVTRPAGEPERARAKQRVNAEAVAKGAELARTRAKASKSRRTGT